MGEAGGAGVDGFCVMTEGVTGAGFAIVSFEVGGEVEEGAIAVLFTGAVVSGEERGRQRGSVRRFN